MNNSEQPEIQSSGKADCSSPAAIRPLSWERYSNNSGHDIAVAHTAVGKFCVRVESGVAYSQLPGGGLEEQTTRRAALTLCRLRYEELVQSCLV